MNARVDAGAAEARLERDGITVLRFDAETCDNIGQLAEAVLAQAARKLSGNLQQAGETVKRLFARLRPSIDYDFTDQTIHVSLGADKANPSKALPLLSDVLNAANRLAGEANRRALVAIDEFQQVIREGGETAERQIRSVVQRHRNVAFAGSKTRTLIDMTNDPGRAFWKLGARYVVGPIPRAPFLEFLLDGFRAAGMSVEAGALEHLIALAEDVPYNVQQLAHMCWERLRVRASAGLRLTQESVDEASNAVVAMENSPYTQLWTSLTTTQRTVVRAVIEERGRRLRSTEVLSRYAIPSSTATRTLRALEDRGIIRQEEDGIEIDYRLEDPFLAAWLRWAQRR